MKKIALTAVVALSVFWLSGCIVVESEDYGPPEEVCVVPVPPPPVEVIYMPGPPRPYHHHHPPYGPPRHWRR